MIFKQFTRKFGAPKSLGPLGMRLVCHVVSVALMILVKLVVVVDMMFGIATFERLKLVVLKKTICL